MFFCLFVFLKEEDVFQISKTLSLSLCLSVRVSLSLSVCLSVCLSLSQSIFTDFAVPVCLLLLIGVVLYFICLLFIMFKC